MSKSPVNRLFGTDGIRDVANHGELTPERVLTLGRAVGQELRRNGRVFGNPLGQPAHQNLGISVPYWGDRPVVLIGGDSRISTPMVESAFSTGLLSSGVDVIRAGMLPTPVIALLTRELGCALGISVTASHNPMADNGIKLLSPEGLKVPDRAERRVEGLRNRLLESSDHSHRRVTGANLGILRDLPEKGWTTAERVFGLYRRSLRQMGLGRRWRRVPIAVDCAHGAWCGLAPRIFRDLGARVLAVHSEADGRRINERCGAVHPASLQKKIRQGLADLGFSFDGDGDRVIAIDEEGCVRDGDDMLGLLAIYRKERRKLARSTVVGTVMTNAGLELWLSRRGLRLVRKPVGDRYVAEELLSEGYSLGGEPSGHIILPDFSPTGDGVITALCVLEALSYFRTSLHAFCSDIRKFPQILRNVPVKRKVPFGEIPAVQDALRRAKVELGEGGRVVVRYSGTQRYLRIMAEGQRRAQVERQVRELARCLRHELG